MKKLIGFFKDEEGATAVEYGIMIGGHRGVHYNSGAFNWTPVKYNFPKHSDSDYGSCIKFFYKENKT